jgi:hypothetical protein
MNSLRSNIASLVNLDLQASLPVTSSGLPQDFAINKACIERIIEGASDAEGFTFVFELEKISFDFYHGSYIHNASPNSSAFSNCVNIGFGSPGVSFSSPLSLDEGPSTTRDLNARKR